MAHYRTDPKTHSLAYLHRHNLTEAEEVLWRVIKEKQLDDVHFRRQHAIGPYIVDFCAPRRKLVIELDGVQHLDQHDYDEERTKFLQSRGYTVLRLWNHEVMSDIDAVLMKIRETLDTP